MTHLHTLIWNKCSWFDKGNRFVDTGQGFLECRLAWSGRRFISAGCVLVVRCKWLCGRHLGEDKSTGISHAFSCMSVPGTFISDTTLIPLFISYFFHVCSNGCCLYTKIHIWMKPVTNLSEVYIYKIRWNLESILS